MPNATPSEPLHEHPDFSTFITDLDHGSINQHLTAKLAELVEAVEDTHKKGTLTIKILVKAENKMAGVAIEVKLDKPQHPLHGTLFHVGQNGALLREDPRQVKMKNLDEPRMRAVDLED